ncbi:ATP-dependent DNA helicase [Trichonephila clavipes]|nr:ATP-dependent DNA helicase [Trichonephila clavipes]
MDILLQYIREIDIGQSSSSAICAAHCILDDGTNIIMVVSYIPLNNSVNIIVQFLYKKTYDFYFGRVGFEELGKNYHTLPLILAGDSNVNFVPEGGQLLGPWVAKWLEHRTPDRKTWVRCLKPPNTLRVHTEYVLVESVGPKVLWPESRVQRTGEYFPPLQFHA